MEFQFVYKICNKSEWLIAKKNKKFAGTKEDKEDEFIHFSDKKQVQGTLKKYYFIQKFCIQNSRVIFLKYNRRCHANF